MTSLPSEASKLAFELTLTPSWRLLLKPLLEAGSEAYSRRVLSNFDDALRQNYDLGKAEGIKSVLAQVEKLAEQHVSKQKSLQAQAERLKP